jgi:hypothetical protein
MMMKIRSNILSSLASSCDGALKAAFVDKYFLNIYLFCALKVGLLASFSAYAVPTQSELTALKLEAMALFATRPPSQALPEPRQQRKINERALAPGWQQALSRTRYGSKQNVFDQQHRYAHNDRRMMHRSMQRPMVILPPDVDIDVALLTLYDNPSFEGATVVLLKMPFLRKLPALQRAYGPLDIRVVENSAIKKELDWVKVPVLVTETGQITKFHF